MRRLLFTLCFLLLMTGTVRARELVQGDSCLIPAAQTIEGNLYVVCRELRIEGQVRGNVIGAATKAVITGSVDGDVLMAAGQLDIQGTMGEDIMFAGVVLRVLAGAQFENPATDIFSLTLSTTLSEDTTLPGSIVGVGYQMLVRGVVNKEISFWGSGLEINGRVDGNVDARVGDSTSDGLSRFPTFIIPFQFDLELFTPGLRITGGAQIGGYLHYSAPVAAEIPEALQAQTVFNLTEPRAEFTPVTMEDGSLGRNVNLYLTQVGQEFATLALIGVIVLFIFPRVLQDPLRYLQSRPLTCMGISVFTLIVMIPIGLAVVVLSAFIVFILSVLRLDDLVFSVGILLGLVNVGGISLFAFVFGFLSRIIVCYAIGRFVLHVASRYTPTPHGQFFSLMMGVIIMAFVTPLPLIGLIVYGIAAALGLGAILSVLQAQYRAARFLNALVGKVDVPPAGKAVFHIPPRLAVAQQDEGRHQPRPLRAFRSGRIAQSASRHDQARNLERCGDQP